jgi:UDP:flavonoid glycosyltransferase YjiC (YdhE family)
MGAVREAWFLKASQGNVNGRAWWFCDGDARPVRGALLSKRIAIAVVGTLGDVQPYLALATALQKAGHSVVLGAPVDFEALIGSYGVEFHNLGSNIKSFLSQSRFEKMSKNLIGNAPVLLAEGQKIVDTAARHAWRMAQNADLIVFHMNTSFCIDVAEALDIPAVMTAMQPLNVTGEFPFVAYYGQPLGRAFNKMTYTALGVAMVYWNLPRNRLRKDLLGLKPRSKTNSFFTDTRGRPLTTLYAYSPLVAPRPRDWPRVAQLTGYWTLEDNTGWEPSPEFRAWLAAGPPPVYFGFGSMPFGAKRNTELLREGVMRWGGRAVVARGWGGIAPEALPETIFAIDRAPHEKLFKHVQGVVHHGGAGTTAAGLRAGKPTFALPQGVDQPFWGRRVHDLGCGPAPIRLKKLTPETLAEGLTEMTTNPNYTWAARALGERLMAEDGVATAISAIERVLTGYGERVEQRKRA